MRRHSKVGIEYGTENLNNFIWQWNGSASYIHRFKSGQGFEPLWCAEHLELNTSWPTYSVYSWSSLKDNNSSNIGLQEPAGRNGSATQFVNLVPLVIREIRHLMSSSATAIVQNTSWLIPLSITFRISWSMSCDKLSSDGWYILSCQRSKTSVISVTNLLNNCNLLWWVISWFAV